ncbi:MAG TPA: DUF4105 domain-containing protein [Burkholderiales bacterium]|nr:DUF4105 domain-containing protein [Burkholderiales bacterium]
MLRLLSVLAALLAPAAVLAADPAYLAELVARSREQRLAERPEWHKLVHYVPNVIAPGVHSLVDSPGFFNAPDGKTDPRAELEATLAQFFVPVEETAERQEAQCTFVARREWLDEKLGFDAGRLPRAACRRYAEWHEALNAKSLTVVFASAYVNNPSSMYGHTLLRVDAADQTERTRLLAYTVNFAANTNETNGLVFAAKGLLGGYPGTYSILPYYIKVREYNDMENRDLWEYQLDLKPEEVERVVRHTWELLSAYYQYFFFDENCSYHLLRLLQVAQPELDLASPFRWWALPSDTVRELTRHPGLVANVVYRPANATIIGARLRALSAPERRIAKELSLRMAGIDDARLAALAPERAAAVLETGHDYVNYRRATGEKDVPDPGVLARELLIARSRLDVPGQAPRTNPGTRPDQGHGSARIGIGAGRDAGRSFQELDMRASYHDLVDDDAGYVRGAQIQFFRTALRHYDNGRARIERFTPLDMMSLAPRSDFFQPMSWRISAGWRRSRVENGSEPLALDVNGGVGAAWELGERALAYALGEGSTRVHHDLRSGISIGAGGRVGALYDPAPRWRVHAYAQVLAPVLGERDSPRAFGLEQRLSLKRDVALRLDLSRRRESRIERNAASLSLLLYF